MFSFCRECGATLTPLEVEVGSHECAFDELLAFQTQCARVALEHGLAAQVEAWEREPRISRQLEFARYLREHAEPQCSYPPRPRAHRRNSGLADLFR